MTSMSASMAEVPPSYLLGLRKGLQAELAFINSSIRQAKFPTENQMISYLQSLCSKIRTFTQKPGMKVVGDTINDALKAISWDMETQQPIGTAPNLDRLQEWLTDLLRRHFPVQQSAAPASKVSVIPTTHELEDFRLACERLWLLDEQRCQPGVDYAINMQKGKNSSWHKGDIAPDPLFRWVKDEIFQRETYKHFISLLDNYEAHTGNAEVVTQHEKDEEDRFLNAVIQTQVGKYLFQYLVKKQKVKSESDLKKFLQNMWFKLYNREARGDSSPFEHVFVGEIREGAVIGMHNWIQLFHEEKSGKFDYAGYIKPKRRGNNSLKCGLDEEQLITIQFEWNGYLKAKGTSFIGTSPEFELALFTICHLFGPEEIELTLGSYPVLIKNHKLKNGSIGSIYPEEGRLTEDEAATRIQSQVRRKQYKGN